MSFLPATRKALETGASITIACDFVLGVFFWLDGHHESAFFAMAACAFIMFLYPRARKDGSVVTEWDRVRVYHRFDKDTNAFRGTQLQFDERSYYISPETSAKLAESLSTQENPPQKEQQND